MAKQELRVELLIGKQVLALNSKPVGRVEEIRAAERAGQFFVEEFWVGDYAALERLAAWQIGRAVLRIFGMRKHPGYRIGWEQIDWSDPDKPRLLCSVKELSHLTEDQIRV